jgi:putative methyltransferase (TIGR04325 family)
MNCDNKEKFYIWEGVYNNFEDASVNTVGPGFEGDTYNNRSINVAKECLDLLDSNKPMPNFHKQRSSQLPIIVSMLINNNLKEKVKILDFGGGLGIGYMVLQESLLNDIDRVDYTIVEGANVCSTGKSLFTLDKIKYYSNFPLSEKYDIVYASSVLQYIDDWKGVLSTMTNLDPEYILLSDIFAGESIQTYTTLQNYYESRIPHWFLNLGELLNHCSSLNYKLIMKSYATSQRLGREDVLPMDNFSEKNQLHMTLHLLFKKIA